jgi:hypothetical protein
MDSFKDRIGAPRQVIVDIYDADYPIPELPLVFKSNQQVYGRCYGLRRQWFICMPKARKCKRFSGLSVKLNLSCQSVPHPKSCL